MIALMLALVLAQETDSVPKNHQKAYELALSEYTAAWLNLESDPEKALQMVDRIFSMPRLNKKDRKIVFEKPNGQLTNPIDFYPNYLRGRIRCSLAKREPENALSLYSAATVDFKTSADAGVKAAEDWLKTARAQVDRLEKPKAAKLPESAPKESAAEQAFREPWFKLIEAHKFKAARDLIDQKGGALPSDKRKEYVRETENQCRSYVAAQVGNFVKAMEVNGRPGQLRGTKPAEFNRLFELPADLELVGSYPELEWARKERPVLDGVRMSPLRARDDEAPGLVDRLIAQMLAAEPLEKTAENRWFKAAAQVVFRYVEEVIAALANQSKDASSPDRHRLRAAAEQVRARWSEALAKVPREFLVRNQVAENPRRLTMLLDEFPVDVDELAKVDLDACFVTESPDSALEQVISELTKIRDEHGAKLPKEDTRKLLTNLIAATAIHDILAGKNVDEVTKGLQELGRSLGPVGGPLAPERFGPKIERIFSAIK